MIFFLNRDGYFLYIIVPMYPMPTANIPTITELAVVQPPIFATSSLFVAFPTIKTIIPPKKHIKSKMAKAINKLKKSI